MVATVFGAACHAVGVILTALTLRRSPMRRSLMYGVHCGGCVMVGVHVAGWLLAGMSAWGSSSVAQDKPKEWDTTQARGQTRDIDFDTSEGTWMNVDVSPDGKWIVFDLLGHIYRMA